LKRVSPAWSLASLVLVLGLAASNLLLWRQVSQLRDQAPKSMMVVNLTNTGAAPGASGLIVISEDGEHGTLVVDSLPQLGDEKQYQLWLVEKGQRTSGGVFSVSRDGYASLWVRSQLPLGHYDTFGVTVEPHGGSPGPTGDRVLAGMLE
jgi:anti-sigma-K factor RskA